MKGSRAEVLATLVSENGWTRGVEVGVANGKTMFRLLDLCPDLFMYGVDIWAHHDGEAEYYADFIHEAHYKGVEKYRPKDRTKLLRMDSVAAADHVADASVDFVFIDADHRTPGVVSDVQAWRPKIRAGGALLGHDIDWPSVQAALTQLDIQHEVLPDNVWRAVG